MSLVNYSVTPTKVTHQYRAPLRTPDEQWKTGKEHWNKVLWGFQVYPYQSNTNYHVQLTEGAVIVNGTMLYFDAAALQTFILQTPEYGSGLLAARRTHASRTVAVTVKWDITSINPAQQAVFELYELNAGTWIDGVSGTVPDISNVGGLIPTDPYDDPQFTVLGVFIQRSSVDSAGAPLYPSFDSTLVSSPTNVTPVKQYEIYSCSQFGYQNTATGQADVGATASKYDLVRQSGNLTSNSRLRSWEAQTNYHTGEGVINYDLTPTQDAPTLVPSGWDIAGLHEPIVRFEQSYMNIFALDVSNPVPGVDQRIAATSYYYPYAGIFTWWDGLNPTEDGDWERIIPSGISASAIASHVAVTEVSGTTYIAVGAGVDGNVHIYERTSERQIDTLLRHVGEIGGLSFSADATLLAVAHGNFVSLYDTSDWSRTTTVDQGGTVIGVDFDASTNNFYTGGNGVAKEWDSAGVLQYTYTHASITAITASSLTTGRFATGDSGGIANVWQSGNLVAVQTINTGSQINALVFCDDDSDRLLSVCSSGIGYVHSVIAGGAPISTLTGHVNRLTSCTYQTAASAITGSLDANIKHWDTTVPAPGFTTLARTVAVSNVAFYDNELYSSAIDRRVEIWPYTPPAAPTIPGTIPELVGFTPPGLNSAGSKCPIKYHPSRNIVAIGDGDGRIFFYKALPADTTPAEIDYLFYINHTSVLGDRVRDIAFSPTTDDIASAAVDGNIKEWTINYALSTYVLAFTYVYHAVNEAICVNYNNSGTAIYAGGATNNILKWAVGVPGAVVTTYTGPTTAVMSVVLKSDDSKVLGAEINGTVWLWVEGTGALDKNYWFDGFALDAASWGACFSQDGTKVISWGRESYALIHKSSILVWDMTSGSLLRKYREFPGDGNDDGLAAIFAGAPFYLSNKVAGGSPTHIIILRDSTDDRYLTSEYFERFTVGSLPLERLSGTSSMRLFSPDQSTIEYPATLYWYTGALKGLNCYEIQQAAQAEGLWIAVGMWINTEAMGATSYFNVGIQAVSPDVAQAFQYFSTQPITNTGGKWAKKVFLFPLPAGARFTNITPFVTTVANATGQSIRIDSVFACVTTTPDVSLLFDPHDCDNPRISGNMNYAQGGTALRGFWFAWDATATNVTINTPYTLLLTDGSSETSSATADVYTESAENTLPLGTNVVGVVPMQQILDPIGDVILKPFTDAAVGYFYWNQYKRKLMFNPAATATPLGLKFLLWVLTETREEISYADMKFASTFPWYSPEPTEWD